MDGEHLQRREQARSPGGTDFEHRARDVDRDIGAWQAGLDQQPRLGAGATARFDQYRAGGERGRDGIDMLAQDGQFGARDVVLGRGADRLEQFTALFVIEPLGRKRAGIGCKAGQHVIAQ